MNVHPIESTTTTFITGWTFADYVKYVNHEAMFHDSCLRKELKQEDGWSRVKETAMYVLTREGTGYNGFPVKVTHKVFLICANGGVPPFDPEEDKQDMGASAATK